MRERETSEAEKGGETKRRDGDRRKIRTERAHTHIYIYIYLATLSCAVPRNHLLENLSREIVIVDAVIGA